MAEGGAQSEPLIRQANDTNGMSDQPARPTNSEDSERPDAGPNEKPDSLVKVTTEVIQLSSPSPQSIKESQHDAAPKPVPPVRPLALLNKLALYTLIVGTVLILACCSFLPFLWYADSTNGTWHWIVAHDILHTLIVGLSEVLKQSITAQIGLLTAMLAALVLERSGTTLGQAASLSFARTGASSKKVLDLLWRQTRGKLEGTSKSSLAFVLIPVISAIFAFTQAITVILVSDLNLAPVPGWHFSYQSTAGFDYHNYTLQYVPSDVVYPQILEAQSSWLRKPAIYPTFAEYYEDPLVEEGISDTGVTLRALLPFASQETRQNLHSYAGTTDVVDARVTCQVPAMSEVQVSVPAFSGTALVLNGTLLSSRSTPMLYNRTWYATTSGDGIYKEYAGEPIEFSCVVGIAGNTNLEGSANGIGSQWSTSLCQLPENSDEVFSGGLISEFQQQPLNLDFKTHTIQDSFNYGLAYLVLNVTNGTVDEWNGIANPSSSQQGFQNAQYQNRGEWHDLIWSGGNQILSVTLCYTSFMTANIPVQIYSPRNRSEPSPEFDYTSLRYSYKSYRDLLGQNKSLDPAQRNILSLQNQGTWIASASQYPPVEPYTRSFMSMPGAYQVPTGGNLGNISAPLWQGWDGSSTANTITPDITHTWLFQEIITTGGSIAFAIQSLFTTLTLMAYYEQLEQFNLQATVRRTEFITTNTPRTARGLIAVLVFTVVHLAVGGLIVYLYLTQCRYSIIGESWQTVAQLVSPATEDFLAETTDNSDEVVKNKCIGRKRKQDRVRIQWMEDLGRVGLVKVHSAGDLEEADAKKTGSVEEMEEKSPDASRLDSDGTSVRRGVEEIPPDPSGGHTQS